MARGFLAAIVILVTGCCAGDLAPRQTPDATAEAESLAGWRAAPALEGRFGGTLHNHAAVGRMERIGRRLAQANPELAVQWHFRILAADKVNAFSLPGGLVYITHGLYQRAEVDEVLLAAVIAHEMAHVVAKDSLKPGCRDAREGLAREISADQRATRYLRAAGFHPQSLANLLRLVEGAQPPGWAAARINNLEAGHNPFDP